MFTLLNAKPVYLGCNLFHRGFVELERSEFKGGAECGYSLNGNIERMSPSYTKVHIICKFLDSPDRFDDVVQIKPMVSNHNEPLFR